MIYTLNITKDPFVVCSSFVEEQISVYANFNKYILAIGIIWLLQLGANMLFNEIRIKNKINDRDAYMYLNLINIGFIVVQIPLILVTLFTVYNFWGY